MVYFCERVLQPVFHSEIKKERFLCLVKIIFELQRYGILADSKNLRKAELEGNDRKETPKPQKKAFLSVGSDCEEKEAATSFREWLLGSEIFLKKVLQTSAKIWQLGIHLVLSDSSSDLADERFGADFEGRQKFSRRSRNLSSNLSGVHESGRSGDHSKFIPPPKNSLLGLSSRVHPQTSKVNKNNTSNRSGLEPSSRTYRINSRKITMPSHPISTKQGRPHSHITPSLRGDFASNSLDSDSREEAVHSNLRSCREFLANKAVFREIFKYLENFLPEMSIHFISFERIQSRRREERLSKIFYRFQRKIQFEPRAHFQKIPKMKVGIFD